ncbi:TetR/AcrR family transcriptional regulator [Teichococcus aestuarii]|uniref:TetR/AcrR family transcriptional regulator n=1 Tax=Teichococcus aestuarii TaxID=568898 RepID=UPI0036233EBE
MDIIAAAVAAFEADGFRGLGVDRVLAPSGTSTRTLYKHFGSKEGLVLAVLEERHRRFAEALEAAAPEGAGEGAGEGSGAEPVAVLFDTLRRWLGEHGARGCMLLRARAEYAGASDEIVALVRRQKQEFRALVATRVAAALGREDARLATQIWLLFEGATAAASVAEPEVVEAAKAAAAALLGAARGAAA